MLATSHSKYRPDIDGLRAIAIISVIAYHAGFPGFSGGFVGVDVFFVISGFLITSLLFDEANRTGRVSLSTFYARRIRRLMPAGLVVVTATLLLGAFFISPVADDQKTLARSAIAFAYFWSNFFFFKKTGGYFDDPSFNLPLLHTWSLAIEEQYYLIWPLIMVGLFFFSGEKRTQVGVMRSRGIWILAGMLVISLSLSVVLTKEHQNFTFYLLPARIWEFAIGGLVGLAGTAFYNRLRPWAEALAFTGLALIVYSIVAFTHETPFPGWAATLPVFGSALLIMGTTSNEQGYLRRALGIKPFIAIGLLSYSWYLWHWPLLSIYRIYNLGEQDLLANAVIVVIALLLAWQTYLWIERPIRIYRPGLFKHTRSTLLIGLGMCLVTFTLANGLLKWHKSQNKSDKYAAIAAARNDHSPYRDTCSLNGQIPFNELPQKACTHGPDGKAPQILLWGDSHADHFMPMLMDKFSDLTVYQLTMSGCVPTLGYETATPAPPKFCATFNQRVFEEITELKKKGLEAIVISARWPSYLWQASISRSEQQANAAPVAPQKMVQARLEMQKNFAAMLDALERAGLRVLVLAPTPELVYFAPQCIGLNRGAYCDAPRTLNDTFLVDTTKALAEVIKPHANTRLAHVVDFFCDQASCFAQRDGKILYLDDDHITGTAARALGDFLSDDLAWLRGRLQ